VSRVFGPSDLLNCYRRGVFPMADARDDPRLFLVDPDLRGVLPLDRFHLSKSLRKTIRRDPFEIRVDTAFSRVMELCAESATRIGRTRGSIRRSSISTARCIVRGTLTAWRPGWMASWWADSTA